MNRELLKEFLVKVEKYKYELPSYLRGILNKKIYVSLSDGEFVIKDSKSLTGFEELFLRVLAYISLHSSSSVECAINGYIYELAPSNIIPNLYEFNKVGRANEYDKDIRYIIKCVDNMLLSPEAKPIKSYKVELKSAVDFMSKFNKITNFLIGFFSGMAFTGLLVLIIGKVFW